MKKYRSITLTLLASIITILVAVFLTQFNRRFVKVYADESVEEYNINLAQSVVNDAK